MTVTPAGGSRVAAVIVTYNRLDKLRVVLEKVVAQTAPATWIYVVDNASTDGTAEYLASEPFPGRVEVVSLPENTGGSGGFSTGMARAYAAGADHVWLMDDDCYPGLDALERLVDGYERAAALAAEPITFACSFVKFADGNAAEMNIAWPAWNWGELLAKGENLVTVRTCSFVSALYPRSTIEQLGLPFAEYFIWFDDAAYALLASRIGPGVQVLDSVVVHDTPQNRAVDFTQVDRDSLWKFAYGARNEASFRLHHESLVAYLLFFVRTQLTMRRGSVPWRLRLKITGRLLAAIGFNPRPGALPPVEPRALD